MDAAVTKQQYQIYLLVNAIQNMPFILSDIKTKTTTDPLFLIFVIRLT